MWGKVKGSFFHLYLTATLSGANKMRERETANVTRNGNSERRKKDWKSKLFDELSFLLIPYASGPLDKLNLGKVVWI